MGVSRTVTVGKDKKSKSTMTLQLKDASGKTKVVALKQSRTKGVAAINAAFAGAYHRPDLRKAALARFSRLLSTAGGVHSGFKPEAGRSVRHHKKY